MKHRFYSFLLLCSIFFSICFLNQSCSTSRDRVLREVDEELLKSTASSESQAIQRLVEAGVSDQFIRQLQIQSLAKPEPIERIIFLNVFGFLSSSDYSVHYQPAALVRIKEFMQHYRKTLGIAEKRYQVRKEVIASLLWVETKFGSNIGKFSLPLVYFSLLQADHPRLMKQSLLELNQRNPAAVSLSPSLNHHELQKKIVSRSQKKATWALDQLVALDQLYQKGLPVFSMKSSFAGAFGHAQFIPSSYRDFAISFSEKENPVPENMPNLLNMRDAILSVANFLHQKGWNNSDLSSQSNALFEYNRIRAYGDVILKLSSNLKTLL